MRLKVVNLNPKMAKEKEFQKALKLLGERKQAEAVGDNSVIIRRIQIVRIGISRWFRSGSGKQETHTWGKGCRVSTKRREVWERGQMEDCPSIERRGCAGHTQDLCEPQTGNSRSEQTVGRTQMRSTETWKPKQRCFHPQGKTDLQKYNHLSSH